MLLNEQDIVANTVYIYLILVFGSIVLATIFLLVRNFLCKKDSSLESSILALSQDDKIQDKSGTDSSQDQQLNPLPKTKSILRHFKTWREPNSLKSESFSQDNNSSGTVKDLPANSLSQYNSKSTEEEAIQYSIDEFLRIGEELSQRPFKTQEVRLSDLLKPHVTLPESRFKTRYEMDEEIDNIKSMLADPVPVTKIVGLFRLLVASSYYQAYSNVQHFHGGFCLLMQSLIDSLTIYSGSSSKPYLQLALVDLASCFLWEHWNWATSQERPMGAKWAGDAVMSAGITAGTVTMQETVASFDAETSAAPRHTGQVSESGQYSEPVVIPEITIFRLLCNLSLGTPAITKEVRIRCVFKLSCIFYSCASSTKCEHHHEMILLVGQGIYSTERESIKVFLYDILLRIVRSHLFCCMEASEVFSSNSLLQDLLFKGIWTEQAPAIKEKSGEIIDILSEKFPEIQSWNKSMKFYQKTIDTKSGLAGAPGSWSNFS